MGFDAYSTSQSDSTNTRKEVDFDALNKYTVETAALQEPETLVGVVAGIVDLGTQEQPDAEVVFKGTAADEEEITAKYPDTYFKDGFDPQSRKPARLKCYPQKAQQSTAIAIDFPSILIDKGQFFGESKPLPLRLWLGGQFYNELTGIVVARPTPLRVVNLDRDAPKPVWSFSKLHLFYKMAAAAKLVKGDEPFLPKDIDKLIGKSFQFQAQVFFKKNDKTGKEYFTENVKFVGAIGRGQKAEEIDNTFLVQFNQENKPEDIQQLRAHVINTMKKAQNFEGSLIHNQLSEAGRLGDYTPREKKENEAEKTPAQPKPSTAKKTTAVKQDVPDLDDLDPDLPF